MDDLKGVAQIFIESLPQCNYFGLSLISISQYYISQSLKAEGYFKALLRWAEIKQSIKNSNFDKTILKNKGNKLFYQYGISFLLFEQLLIKLRLRS